MFYQHITNWIKGHWLDIFKYLQLHKRSKFYFAKEMPLETMAFLSSEIFCGTFVAHCGIERRKTPFLGASRHKVSFPLSPQSSNFDTTENLLNGMKSVIFRNYRLFCFPLLHTIFSEMLKIFVALLWHIEKKWKSATKTTLKICKSTC